MTTSLRLAAAAAASALACVLWVALGGSEADPGSGLEVRPESAERAEEAAGGPADLSAVHADERRRAEVPSASDTTTSTDARSNSGHRVTGRVRAEPTFTSDAVTTVWAHRPGAAEEEARSVTASNLAPREWAFESLPRGSWVFTAFVVEGERVALGSVGPVDVLAGGAPILIEALEYSVGGVVTDANGQPIEGVTVSCWWASSDENRLPDRHFPPRFASVTEPPSPRGSLSINGPSIDDMQSATTDAMGRFSFAVAGPGAVELHAPASDFIGWEGLSFQSEGSTTTIRLGNGQLDLAATNIVLNFEPVDTSSPEAPQSVGNGASPSLEEQALLEGLFRNYGSSQAPDDSTDSGPDWLASSVEVQLTEAEPQVHQVTIQLFRTARLRGRLRAGAGGPEGIDCFLRLLSKSAPKSAARQQHTSTDENGEFTFERCAPGEYFLYARSGGEAGQDYSLRLAFTLDEDEERYIDDRLTPSGRIRGIVHDREGLPLVGVDVRATGRRNGNLTRRATTDASGMYTLTGLYEGEYEVKLANNGVERSLIIEVPPGGAVLEADPLVASDI